MGTAVGIDIGGGSVKTVVLEGDRVVDRRISRRDRSIADLVAGARRLAAEAGAPAVGVGLAGLVDRSTGRFLWGPHLTERAVDVASLLEGVALTSVDNDANCAALAEATVGAAAGASSSLTVSIGTGIGAGWVIDGRIVRGAGLAGEVGHMRMIDDGELCACGRTGCWETLVSGRVLDFAASEMGLGESAADLVEAARSGHVAASSTLTEAGTRLGQGVANLILAVDPGVVVLSGGIAPAADRLLPTAQEWIASAMPGSGHRPLTAIVGSTLGRWAAATGAALMAAGDRRTDPTNRD